MFRKVFKKEVRIQVGFECWKNIKDSENIPGRDYVKGLEVEHKVGLGIEVKIASSWQRA